MNEQFYKFTKSNVNNYCISQKHETSFENETLITPKPRKNTERLQYKQIK